MQNTRLCSFFNSISVWSIVLVPVVALVGFIPFAPLWVEGSKVLISGILISIASIAYAIEGLLAKRFSLPHKHVLAGTSLYAAAVLVTTIFTKGGELSLFGIGIEAWTVTHIFVGFLFFLLVAVHAQNSVVRKKLTYVLVFGALIAVFYQLIRILSLGQIGAWSIFADPVTNTLGRWFDIGIISLLLILASVVFFALKASSRLTQVVSILIFVVSFTFFVIVSPLLGLLLLAMAALFVQNSITNRSENTSRKNIASRVLLFVSLFACVTFVFQGLTGRSPFFFQSEIVSTFSQTRADIVYRDFPVTFISDSFVVVKSVVKESPVFGVGAARFQEAWAQYRPMAINQTAWWATDFGIGSGILATVIVMFGILGLLGLFAFLFIIFRGLYISLSSENISEKMFALSASVVWLYALLQTPSAGLMLVIFTLTGIVFSFKEGMSFSLVQRSQKGLALIVVVLVLTLPVYGIFTRTLALSYAIQAERAIGETPARVLDAENALLKASALAPHEVYYQALASVQQRALADISTQITNKEISEAEGIEIYSKKLVDIRETYDNSVKANPQNYVSYFTRAQFFSNFVGQGNDATSTAIAFSDVQMARTLAPSNATIDILEAQLHLLKNNGDEAQKLLLDAVNKKPNYTDAALILSQLKIQQKNYADALVAAEYAVRTNVNSSQALYVYGQLQFAAKNYLVASQAFERITAVERTVPLEVVRLLADSYAEIGSLEQARRAYEEILKVDPDNTEVKEMLVKIQEAVSQSVVPAESETASPSGKK